MEENDIDILCFSGHRGLMGPQGTGGICVRPGIEIHPLKVGGSGVQSYSKTHPTEYPARLEAGTLNSHGIAGLSAALDALGIIGWETIHKRQQTLAYQFAEKAAVISGITLLTSLDDTGRIPVVSLFMQGKSSETVVQELAERCGIFAGCGAAYTPLSHRQDPLSETGSICFSFSYFNTEADVERAIDALKDLYM